MQQQCLQNYFGEQLKEVRAMAQEKINAARRQTNLPNESDEYLSEREEVRLAEIELMRQRERIAELRRALPQGAADSGLRIQEGPANLDAGDTPIRTVRLSELCPSSSSRSIPDNLTAENRCQRKPTVPLALSSGERHSKEPFTPVRTALRPS